MTEWMRNTLLVIIVGVSGWFAIDYLYLRERVSVALENAASKSDLHTINLSLNTIGVKLDALGKMQQE